MLYKSMFTYLYLISKFLILLELLVIIILITMTRPLPIFAHLWDNKTTAWSTMCGICFVSWTSVSALNEQWQHFISISLINTLCILCHITDDTRVVHWLMIGHRVRTVEHPTQHITSHLGWDDSLQANNCT